MPASEPRETKCDTPADSSQIDDGHPPSAFNPTPLQMVLFAIGVLFASDRCSSAKFVPFESGLIAGIIPLECCLWTLILLHMAIKDMVQLYGDAKEYLR